MPPEIHPSGTAGLIDAARLRFLRMGMRALWIAFGAATFYILGAVVVPTVVVILRQQGMDVSDDTATNLSRLAALLASALGGALGLRHARRVEARRDEN